MKIHLLSRMKSSRGEALNATIVIGLLISAFFFGMVSVYGDNIRALFAAMDERFSGADAIPASGLATPASCNMKGPKGARLSGEEAGRLAATSTAIQAALNDPHAFRMAAIADLTVIGFLTGGEAYPNAGGGVRAHAVQAAQYGGRRRGI